MMLAALSPAAWKIVAAGAVAAGAVAAGVAYRSHVWESGYKAAVSERAAADLVAVVRRTSDNAALSIKQGSINAIITKAKHEELAPVVQRIYVDRVRVGAAICSGPTSPAEANSPPSSHGAYPTGRLLPPDVERDIRALIRETEEVAATARACQSFVRENGLGEP